MQADTLARVTTCMENLEMLGILTAVSEMCTNSQGSVREKIMSGKSGLKRFIVSCIFASILDFAEFVHFILVSDQVLLHSYPTTDNNTSTGTM